MEEQRQQLQTILREYLDQHDPVVARLDEQQLKQHAIAYLQSLTPTQNKANGVEDEQYWQQMISDVVGEAIGLGPLESLLQQSEISEIMVNRYDRIFIEKEGRLQRSSACFSDEAALRRAIDRIVLPLGRHIDEASPMVDARLADGSRMNAVLAPLAMSGSCLTIRKFSPKPLSLEDLVRSGSLSASAAEFLTIAVQCRQNVIISGGTGTGKTTLLNTLSAQIPEHERLITIEDAAELQLQHDNLIGLETRPKNQEGNGEIGIRQLVINALRMRPDRLIVGECRGAEALDMLQAMNTGHDGSLSTVHANNARDAVRRLEVMVLMSGLDLPVTAIRQQIASAVNLIIQIARRHDGKRIVTGIHEVTGIDGDTLQIAALFERSQLQQALTHCGVPASFAMRQPETVQRALQQCFS